MSMKTAQEARKGDRIWCKSLPDGKIKAGTIDSVPLILEHKDGFGDYWGYLADNEAVIGGQILRNPKSDLWYVGVSSHWADSILENHKGFDDWCKTLDLSDADKAAIQEHVRRHSAPAPKPKRTAKDAKIGDEVWLSGYVGQIQTSVTHVYTNSVEIGDAECFDFDQFGTDWGFWEDRPDAQEAKPDNTITHWGKLPESDDTTQALPIPEPAAKPNPDSDAAILARKGAQWVRVNRPDIWKRLKADLMEKTRQEGDKLAKPGILAGKTANPWG